MCPYLRSEPGRGGGRVRGGKGYLPSGADTATSAPQLTLLGLFQQIHRREKIYFEFLTTWLWSPTLVNSAICKTNCDPIWWLLIPFQREKMRWIWTFMIGFTLLFLTSMILPPWDRWAPFRSLYKGSSLELDRNCSTNNFSFNLEQCPSCSRSVQKTTCRWSLFPDLIFDRLFADFIIIISLL